jgi:GDPmannose 4,6-dehydratase
MDYRIIGIDYKNIYQDNESSRSINIKADISDPKMVHKLIQCYRPIEIYHLAAFHGSSEDDKNDFKNINKSMEVNFYSTLNILNSIKKCSPKTKLFYASSSQIFGEQKSLVQDEQSDYNPNNIYGLSKSLSTQLCHY